MVDVLTRKVMRPSDAEIAANPRARSAKMRVAEKLMPGRGSRRKSWQSVTEFHTVKRIDNSRLARPIASGRLREMARLIGLGALACRRRSSFTPGSISSTCSCAIRWNRSKSQRSQASELNQELKLEVAGLRAPSRIDEIARRQLRLTAPVPGQVAPLEGPFEPVVAQVRPSGSDSATQ